MRFATIALACGALALTAGCNRKSEQAAAPAAPVAQPAPVAAPAEPHIEAPNGFAHQAQFDASGYYLSVQPVQVGNFRMTHLGIGAPSDFSQWEKGDRAAVFGPLLFQFEDVTTPVRQAGETGAESHTVGVRVLPQAYRFEPGKVSFKGSDPKLGEVVFDGTFDQAALAKARAEGSSQAPVLRGKLKIGDAPIQDVSLVYWVGD